MVLTVAQNQNSLWRRLPHPFSRPLVFLPIILLVIIYVTFPLPSSNVFKSEHIPIIEHVETQQENEVSKEILDSSENDQAVLEVEKEQFIKGEYPESDIKPLMTS